MCEGDARVDEGTGGEDRSSLFGGRFEREVWKKGGSGVVCESDEVGVGCAALDGTDDEFPSARNVLEWERDLCQ